MARKPRTVNFKGTPDPPPSRSWMAGGGSFLLSEEEFSIVRVRMALFSRMLIQVCFRKCLGVRMWNASTKG